MRFRLSFFALVLVLAATSCGKTTAAADTDMVACLEPRCDNPDPNSCACPDDTDGIVSNSPTAPMPDETSTSAETTTTSTETTTTAETTTTDAETTSTETTSTETTSTDTSTSSDTSTGTDTSTGSESSDSGSTSSGTE